MKKILLIILSIPLFANDLILPNENLFITRYKNLEYIYSKDINISDIINFQSNIVDIYRSEFGFDLDDTLYVTINSNKNQLANGISTQIPLNSQFLYMGGANYIDYFCFNSWTKNLLIHETAHNFQLNPKENGVSKIAHKIFKNNPFTYIGLFPIFPIPNIMINSFLLEGNSVLNESRFGNGGRLYSGYALAELIELIKADKITPKLMYNRTLEFPYGEKSYLIGGFFQKFLAKRYGIDRVNGYFKTYSKQITPLYVNATFKKQFGKDFETLLDEFVKETKEKYKNYKRANGEPLIESQMYVPMNRFKNEILFLVGNFRDYPNIAIFNGKKLKLKRGSYKRGKVFKIDNRYWTQSVSQISPTKIKFGLFNENGYIKEDTEGKAIQGFLPNGKAIYFDINKSNDKPHIYIDNRFYDISNSSVFIDKSGNIYYFKQQKNIRTLYKNRKALLSYRGYYGFITDVDKNKIYFIAPTKNGSGVYLFNGKEIKRAIMGDNIIDFKLIDSKNALINTIEDSKYLYKIATIKPRPSKIMEFKELKFKRDIKIEKRDIALESKEYRPLFNLKYSAFNQVFGFDSSDELFFNLKADFSDPTTYNLANISLFKDDNKIVGGLGYVNRENLVEFEAKLFGAKYDNGEDSIGYNLNLELPLKKEGYYSALVGINYKKDYDSIQRPATLYLSLRDNRSFGISKYSSSLNSLNIFLTEDRDNFLYGFDYRKFHQFGEQNFIEFNVNSIVSSNLNPNRAKGIKLDDSLDIFSKSPIEVELLNLDSNRYVKDITSFEIGLYKSFDTPLYYFSFPISLQRTTIYSKYRRFNIKNYKQTTLGIEGDFVFFNNFTLPIKFEYIDTPYSRDDYMFRVFSGVEF